MKFLVITSGPCLSLGSCRWYDVQPSDGFVSSCLSSLAVPNLGVCGPILSERSPDLLEEVLSVKKFLKSGFKQGMQAHAVTNSDFSSITHSNHPFQSRLLLPPMLQVAHYLFRGHVRIKYVPATQLVDVTFRLSGRQTSISAGPFRPAHAILISRSALDPPAPDQHPPQVSHSWRAQPTYPRSQLLLIIRQTLRSSKLRDHTSCTK